MSHANAAVRLSTNTDAASAMFGCKRIDSPAHTFLNSTEEGQLSSVYESTTEVRLLRNYLRELASKNVSAAARALGFSSLADVLVAVVG
jgi:hypothetical protein